MYGFEAAAGADAAAADWLLRLAWRSNSYYQLACFAFSLALLSETLVFSPKLLSYAGLYYTIMVSKVASSNSASFSGFLMRAIQFPSSMKTVRVPSSWYCCWKSQKIAAMSLIERRWTIFEIPASAFVAIIVTVWRSYRVELATFWFGWRKWWMF